MEKGWFAEPQKGLATSIIWAIQQLNDTVNIAGWDPYTMCESQNDDAWLDAAELFKSTFGQNLHGYVPIDSGMHSWSECLSDEARILLGRKQEDDISTSEIWELISAETKKQLRVVISEVGEE